MTTPTLVIGDTFKRAATLKSGDPSGAYDVSAASAITIAVISKDHARRYCPNVALSSSESGSNWLLGEIVIAIPKATTAQIGRIVSRPEAALFELQATIGGEDYTWFADVKLIPGII